MKKNTKKILSIVLAGLIYANLLLIVGATNIEINDSKREIPTNEFDHINQLNYEGQTLYVGGNGPGNFSTIQDAIDNSSNGDTVYVFDESSIYNEFLSINSSIKLIGENKETTRIGVPNDGIIITINADNVQISNFTFSREIWYDTGIQINANKSTIQDNIFIGKKTAWSVGSTITSKQTNNHLICNNSIIGCAAGIQLDHQQYTKIINNNIDAPLEVSIRLLQSHNCEIRANTLLSRSGIRIDECTNTHIINNTQHSVNNNLHHEYFGIAIEDSKDNLIKNNAINNSGFTIRNSENNKFESNTVNGKPFIVLKNVKDRTISTAGQLYLIDCKRITVEKLQLTNLNTGIVFIRTTNSIVKNNSLSSCSKGIQLLDSSQNTIETNTIIDNYEGITLEQSYQNQLTGNIIQDTKWGIQIDESSENKILENTITNSTYSAMTIIGSNNEIIGNNITLSSNAISCFSAINCKIKDNKISNNYKGLEAINSVRNIIDHNFIESNEIGIKIYQSSLNTIKSNDFKRNKIHANFADSLFNRWNHNYWGRPIIRPKPLIGSLTIGYRSGPMGSTIPIQLPWFNYDWIPAKIPNTLF